MIEKEKYNWLLLAFTPNIGSVRFLSLIQQFENIENIFNATAKELSQVVPQKAAQAIKDQHATQVVEQSLEWENSGTDCSLLTLLDTDYPLALTHSGNPPPVLFVRGQRNLLQKRKISIVGSRHPTPQGIQNARHFAHDLCMHGYTIVSGLASGIDTAAHEGALKASGKTIAILGTGIDRVYPSHNKNLAHQLTQTGLLISEFPLGTKPIAGNFPRRNRIISGLSEATLVVEATIDSGSLITARLAGQMNKEVMAIPGSIHNPQSKGCHKLIKDGAKLVESLEDILVELPSYDPNAHIESDFLLSCPINKSADEESTTPLLETMGFDPIHPDLLAQQLNMDAAELYQELLVLELDGKIKPLAGGRFQRLF